MGGIRRGRGRGAADNGLWRKKMTVNNLVPEEDNGEMSIKLKVELYQAH